MTAMIEVRRAGKFVANFRAEHVESADRLRYELAQAAGRNSARCILRGLVATYSDGTRAI